MGGRNPADHQAGTCVGPVAQTDGWSAQGLHGKKARGRRSRHPGAETGRAETYIRPSVHRARWKAVEEIQFPGTSTLDKALLQGPEKP